jgi:hypothetical protein
MTHPPVPPLKFPLFACVLVVLCVTGGRARCEDRPDPLDPNGRPLVLQDLNLWAALADTATMPPPRTPRLRLPRMPLTSLGDPLGLNPDSDDLPPDAEPAAPDNDRSGLQVAMGADNPFFDFRRRGSPGGVGYYKLHTQLQLFDTGVTGCTLTCQAVRPAGLESNGINDGPSFVSPALSVFHDFGDGTALHGFVSKDVRANSAWREGVTDGAFHYGLALQQPLPLVTADPGRGLFVFVEALGRYGEHDGAAGYSWEVVPGLHYRVSDSWWLSGGLLLPLGPFRSGNAGQWHVGCQWQY